MRLASSQPGYFEVRVHDVAGAYLHFMCPCGCDVHSGHCSTIPLALTQDEKQKHGWHCWLWDGDTERPTLQPSLRQVTPCGWHCRLTQGAWTNAGDGAPTAPNVYKAP
jgi:hypothetical protein